MNSFIEIVKDKSDEDLLAMVYEFDQWSPEMLEAVEQELTKRNILPTDISTRRQEAIELEDIQLSQGKEASVLGQVVGWLTIFGLLGIFIGHNYAFSKVRSKYSDKQYFTYNDESRKNGSYMFYAALIVLFFSILYTIFKISGGRI